MIARNQQVVRVDRERPGGLTGEQLEWVCDYLAQIVPSVDAIIVADYGKGFLSQSLADELCRLAQRHSKILTVDPHPHTSLVWRGATGMLLFDGEEAPLYLPARAKEVFDVSGAGDTAIAVFTLGLVAGAAPAQAAELANRASGIVVGKLGTATVTAAELAAACSGLC